MSRPVRAIAGYLVAAASLVWVFHDVDVDAMLRSMRGLRWSWVAAAIAVDILSYATQAVRWKLLLTTVGRLRWLHATQAIYAGLFASEVLPMRPGEVLRAFLVSRRLGAPASAVFPSIMVERLFDGVWLAIGVGVAAALIPLPANLVRAGDILGLAIVLATVLFGYEVLRTPTTRAAGIGEAEPASVGRLERFRRQFRDLGRRRETYVAFPLSLVLLIGQILAFWLVMVAYGLPASLWVGAATLVIIHLGTAIPNAPANVGTYQFFCVVALTIFGIDKTVATGFSVVVFIVLTIPLWLLGSLALARSGETLAGVRTYMRLKPSDA
jgi:uncharacterized protein (TIRG00374 family)